MKRIPNLKKTKKIRKLKKLIKHNCMISSITVTNDDGTTQVFIPDAGTVPPIVPEVITIPLDTDIKIIGR